MCYNLTMRKRRRLLLIVFLLFIAAGLGLYAAAQRFLPDLVRRKIVAGLTEATRRRVTCGTINLVWWRGIVIRDLRVYDKTDAEKTILCVDEASAAFLLLPWGKERKLLIPSLQIYGTRLDLVRGPDGMLNVQDIIDRRRASAAGGIRPVVKNLTITDSEIVLRDETRTPPTTTMVRLAEGRARASWNKLFIDAKAEVSLDGIPVPVACHGNYAYKEKRWDVRLTGADIDPKPFLPRLPALPFTWKGGLIRELRVDAGLQEGTLTVKPRLVLDGVAAAKEKIELENVVMAAEAAYEARLSDWMTGRLGGRCIVKTGDFHISEPAKADGRLTDCQGAFTWQDRRLEATFTGTAVTPHVVIRDTILKDVRADIQTRIVKAPSADETPSTPILTTKAGLSAAEAVGVPRVDTAQDITVEVAYESGVFTFQEGKATVLGHPIKGEGHIRDKRLEASIAGTFPLADVTRFLSQEVPWPGHEISGTADAVITFERTFETQEATRIAGEAVIHDIWLNLKQLDKTLSAETGTVQFDIPSQMVQWESDDIFYDNASYACLGTITDFSAPHISLDIKGPNLSLRADAAYCAPQVTFNDCSGRWHDSVFRFKGTWDKAEGTVDVKGEAVVQLEDLGQLPETAPPVLKKIAGQGPCRVTASLKGPLKKPALWTLRADATSDAVRLAGYYIRDIAVAYEQAGRQGLIRDAAFTAYEGTGLIRGRLDLTQTPPAFALRGAIDGLDLERFKVDTPLRGRTFFGTLSLNVSTQGTIGDPKSITGGGHLTITNGNIWEFNPLRGLGSFLFVPHFSNIVFTTAEGDYYLREGSIETSNLTLKGRELDLLIEGKVGFGGEIDALVYTQAPLGPGEKIKVFALADQALTRTGNLTAIKITGTVKEPKYRLQNIGSNIIKKVTDLFSSIIR